MIDMQRARPAGTERGRSASAPVRAIRWWLGELDGAWRDACAILFRAPRRTGGLVIEAGTEDFTVCRQSGADRRVLGRVARPGTGREAMDPRLRAALAGSPGRVIVELAAADTLTRRLRLPDAGPADLARMLRFELAKHLPFPIEEACWYFRPVGPAPGRGATREVEVSVAPLALAVAIRDELAALGIAADGFVAADLPADARSGLSFLPPAPGAASSGRSVARMVAVVLVLAAAGASLASPLLADRARLETLGDEIARLEPAAKRGLAVREQTLRDGERGEALRRMRQARPDAVATLALLTGAIDDASWLVSLALSGPEVVIDGRSPSAAAVAAALERTGRFERVSFRAPIARDPATGLERFQIAAILTEARP
jgi:general secretion pathway protein L